MTVFQNRSTLEDPRDIWESRKRIFWDPVEIYSEVLKGFWESTKDWIGDILQKLPSGDCKKFVVDPSGNGVEIVRETFKRACTNTMQVKIRFLYGAVWR